MPGDTLYAPEADQGIDQTASVTGQAPSSTQNTTEPDLLSLPPSEAATRLLQEWDESYKDMRNLFAQWKVNRARSQGFTGVRLIKKPDESTAYIPLGAVPNLAGMNKALRLKRRLRSVLYADPPAPECTPSKDTDEARAQAEFGTRALVDLSSEGNVDYVTMSAEAFDLASDYGSGFIRFWVDPQAGGWRPKQVTARPEAMSAQDPMPEVGEDGTPLLSQPIARYVTPDGMFTDDPDQADREWLPKLQRELLTGKNVRMIPPTCRDLWEADGVQIGALVPLAMVKSTFPEVASMSDSALAKLVSSRPMQYKELLPPGRKDRSDAMKGDSYVFVLTRVHVQSPQYPKGAYLIALGDGTLAYRGEWWDAVHRQPLDLPLTQHLQYADEENPYGKGIMEFLGPGNEIRAIMLGAMLEHLDRFKNRKVFVPITSNLRPEQLQSETGTPIYVAPGGEPKYENLPDFPAIVEKMYNTTSADLDDESGLQQVAQGLNSPSVNSGLHAQTIIEQVNVALSDLRQHEERALVRGWRVMLQQVRAFYTTPQRIGWVGDDGAYKEQFWTAQDLGDTQDVRLDRTSFTQLAPSAKAALAQSYRQLNIIDDEDLRHIVVGNVGGLIGVQDDPHRQRVRRQIKSWQDGPPRGWMAPQPQQTQQGIQTPPDRTLLALFDPLPCDQDPTIAKMRAYELGRALAGTDAQKHPPAWRAGLAQAYEQARTAAGLFTVQEQQQAQQQAQQAGTAPKISLSGKLSQPETDAEFVKSGGSPQAAQQGAVAEQTQQHLKTAQAAAKTAQAVANAGTPPAQQVASREAFTQARRIPQVQGA